MLIDDFQGIETAFSFGIAYDSSDSSWGVDIAM